MSESPLHETESATSVDSLRAWNTVVLNDPINHQSYVTHVFRTHFGYNRSKAHSLMMQVHEEGRAIVSSDGREKAESHVSAMHGYGLHAILESTE